MNQPSSFVDVPLSASKQAWKRRGLKRIDAKENPRTADTDAGKDKSKITTPKAKETGDAIK